MDMLTVGRDVAEPWQGKLRSLRLRHRASKPRLSSAQMYAEDGIVPDLLECQLGPLVIP